jgi:hypothetical protein
LCSPHQHKSRETKEKTMEMRDCFKPCAPRKITKIRYLWHHGFLFRVFVLTAQQFNGLRLRSLSLRGRSSHSAWLQPLISQAIVIDWTICMKRPIPLARGSFWFWCPGVTVALIGCMRQEAVSPKNVCVPRREKRTWCLSYLAFLFVRRYRFESLCPSFSVSFYCYGWMRDFLLLGRRQCCKIEYPIQISA